jgi:hypothetical protein
MAGVISVVSVYFSRLRTSFEEGFHHRQPNPWRRHLLGAAVTGVIAITVALATDYFGLTEHGLELSPSRQINLSSVGRENSNATIGLSGIPPTQHNALDRELSHAGILNEIRRGRSSAGSPSGTKPHRP